MDSLRYKSLIFDNDVNLRLMYYVCNKWCVPTWLTEAIDLQITQSKKLMSVTTFIDSLTNGIYKCKNCGVGFNKYNNKAGSCKSHRMGTLLQVLIIMLVVIKKNHAELVIIVLI